MVCRFLEASALPMNYTYTCNYTYLSELTKEREKRKNFENLLHDQSDLKAAMTLVSAGTQLADDHEESDSDYT